MFPLGGPARVLACATSRFGGRAFLGLFCASSCDLSRVAPRVLGAVALLFLLLLYEAPGGNQVDGLPPAVHSL